MENAYYVMHPTLGITAVVHAPTTEKARTTFLDWLERNRYILRRDRHSFRRNMSTKRLEDPNVQSDVVLHYGYEEARIPKIKSPVRETIESIASKSPESEEDLALTDFITERALESPTDEELLEEAERGLRKEAPTVSPKPKLMPIQQIMLRGY